MQRRRITDAALAALAAVGLAGCAAARPPVAFDARPREGAGYLAVVVTATAAAHMAAGFDLGFVNEATGEELVLEVVAVSGSRQARMIEVAPGTYRLTFSRLGLRTTRKISGDLEIGRSFPVGPGEVMVVGVFGAEASQDFEGSRVVRSWGMVLNPDVPSAEAVGAVKGAYWGFDAAPFRCLLCAPDRPPRVSAPGASAIPPARW